MYECMNLDYCRWCPDMLASPVGSPCVPKPSVKCIWKASPTIPYTFATDKCPWPTTKETKEAFAAAEAEAAELKKEQAAKEKADQAMYAEAHAMFPAEAPAAAAAGAPA